MLLLMFLLAIAVLLLLVLVCWGSDINIFSILAVLLANSTMVLAKPLATLLALACSNC